MVAFISDRRLDVPPLAVGGLSVTGLKADSSPLRHTVLGLFEGLECFSQRHRRVGPVRLAAAFTHVAADSTLRTVRCGPDI